MRNGAAIVCSNEVSQDVSKGTEKTYEKRTDNKRPWPRFEHVASRICTWITNMRVGTFRKSEKLHPHNEYGRYLGLLEFEFFKLHERTKNSKKILKT
jgi:hypothetical protein